MELGITQSTDIHNTRSLIRAFRYVLDILQTEEAFTVEGSKHTHTHPNLNAKLKRKLQIMQNKCIRFSLKLDKMHHISEDFKTVNWLPVGQRVQQSLNVTVFKYVK